jgi:DNA-binding FadR family transcriptional regulator
MKFLDRLIGAMQSGEYAPGSQLPSERELMVRFGVGRPAIREALQTLQQMGLIRITHGERARVIVPTPQTVVDQISGAMVQLLASNPRWFSRRDRGGFRTAPRLAQGSATQPRRLLQVPGRRGRSG